MDRLGLKKKKEKKILPSSPHLVQVCPKVFRSRLRAGRDLLLRPLVIVTRLWHTQRAQHRAEQPQPHSSAAGVMHNG